MPCMCCACEACKKDQIKTKLMASMPFEVRSQTQTATAEWFLNQLVDLEYRLKKTESYIADKLVAEVTKPDKNISWRLEDR